LQTWLQHSVVLAQAVPAEEQVPPVVAPVVVLLEVLPVVPVVEAAHRWLPVAQWPEQQSTSVLQVYETPWHPPAVVEAVVPPPEVGPACPEQEPAKQVWSLQQGCDGSQPSPLTPQRLASRQRVFTGSQ
jgi:hypothetical protein